MKTAITSPSAPAAAPPTGWVLRFDQITLDDLPRVGGKNASLGEMVQALAPTGVRVPDGFALTADAFRLHLREAGLAESIYRELDAQLGRRGERLLGELRAVEGHRNRLFHRVLGLQSP